MTDAVFYLGKFSVYGFGLLSVFAFLWGAYVFYRKAIESHFEEFQILDAVVAAAFWAFILGRLGFVLLNFKTFWMHFSRVFLFSNFPGIERYGVYLGIFWGVYLVVKKFKGKFLDWFDLVSVGVMASTAIFYAGISLFTFSWQYSVSALISLLAFMYFWNIEDKYRTFGWYRNNKTSARSGLITGFSIMTLGLIYELELFLFGKKSLEAILWGAVLLVGGIVLVYIRSGRTVSEDLKIIFKNGRKQKN